MICFLLSFFWLATANIDVSPESVDYGEQFARIITRAAMRLQRVAPRRPLKIKHWNDSLEWTAQAARGLASHQSPQTTMAQLDGALEAYEQNAFAVLLKALVTNEAGETAQANRFFEEFLLQSQTFTGFEEAFLKWGEFHRLRRTVYGVLQSRGITFEGRERQIRARIPFESLIGYAMQPGREDAAWNWAFLGVIVLGGPLLILMALSGTDFSRPLPGALLFLYVAVWIAYGVWIWDLAFGLPYEVSRFQVIPWLLGFSLGFVLLQGLLEKLGRRRRLEKGYRFCPYCGAAIPELSMECFECRKKL